MDEWKKDANCLNMDTSLFFSELGSNVLPFVREVCDACPVIEECLWYANETGSDHGVFGGMTPTERRLWRRDNNIELGDRRAA